MWFEFRYSHEFATAHVSVVDVDESTTAHDEEVVALRPYAVLNPALEVAHRLQQHHVGEGHDAPYRAAGWDNEK